MQVRKNNNELPRELVLNFLAQGYPLEERAFTVAEAQEAREAFLSSSTSLVLPITAIDGRKVGDGVAGPLALALRKAYLDFVMAEPAVL